MLRNVDVMASYDEEAAEKVKEQIPDSFRSLHPRHKDARYSDYGWHWYLVNGYDDTEDG